MRYGRAEVARALIKAGACVCTGLYTPLHYAAAYHGPALVSELLAAGANVNARVYLGATPLMWADDPAVVAVLVSGGADIEARSDSRLTPLAHFMLFRLWGCALALLELGADVSDPRLLFLLLK